MRRAVGIAGVALQRAGVAPHREARNVAAGRQRFAAVRERLERGHARLVLWLADLRQRGPNRRLELRAAPLDVRRGWRIGEPGSGLAAAAQLVVDRPDHLAQLVDP